MRVTRDSMALGLVLGMAGCGGGPGRTTAAAVVEPPADAPVLAMMPLKAEGTAASDAAIISDLVRQELLAVGRWRVVDRAAMDAAMAGKALAIAGVGSDADAASLGKLLNARLMGVGSYGLLMGTKVVTFRIVDVETGLAKWAGTAEGATQPDLKRSLAAMVATFK